MRQDLESNSPALEQRAGQSQLLSRLYREVGMAVVAAELDLQLDMLEAEDAAAVRRGAAVLAPPGVLAA
jgi:hypothetical protein